MVSNLRLEDASIYNFIKHELLARDFIEQLENVELELTNGVYTPVLTGYDPSPASTGRGLVIFDDTLVNGKYIIDTTSEQTSKVSVSGATSYDIDYITGAVKNPDTAPTDITFYWHYVSTLDAWPGTDPPALPIVSVDMRSTYSLGLQLGGGKRKQRICVLDVFATNRAERDEITDALESGLIHRTITVKDFSQGNYLNYDGTYNSSFDHSPSDTSPIYIKDISVRFLGTDVSWDVINKYRSSLEVSYETIQESD